MCEELALFSPCETFFFQELREQVERLEAELEDYKKGVPPVTALAPYRGRTQSWKGMLLRNNSIAIPLLDSFSYLK